MKRTNIIIVLLVATIAINIGLLGFIFSHKPPKRQKEPKEFIIEKLNFDKQQIQDYEKLIDWHVHNIHESQSEMNTLKNRLYLTLQNEPNQIHRDSIINQIALKQVDIENINYKHFNEIKALCKPEQLEHYNMFCIEIAQLFAPPKPPRHEPR